MACGVGEWEIGRVGEWESGVQSVECKALSEESGVWSVKCGVRSVKCRV